jgi:hypothetical protein
MLTTNDPTINRKIFILQAKTNQVAIAKKLKVCRQAINNELRGVYRSEKIRLGICKITGIPKEVFWPEFYNATFDDGGEGGENVCTQTGQS